MQTDQRTFDDAKLASMVEPLTVRVEKLKGSTRTPIPLPSSEDSEDPPGTNWAKEDVRKLENFLVTDWSGGGLYEITVTDSTVPHPIVMKWKPYFEPKQYPELTPPPLAGAANTQSTPTAPSTPAQVRTPMPPAFPNGFPSGNYPMVVPNQQSAHYPMPAPPPMGTQAWAMWQAEADRRKQDEELRQLREQNLAREREAAEARHKAELDRVRAEADQKAQAAQRALEQKIAEMQTNMTALMQQLTTAQRPAVDPQVEAMREQNRLLEAKMERDRQEAAARERDRELREMMRTMIDESNKRTDTLQRMFEQQMSAMREQFMQLANNSNKPDQLNNFVMLMQEQARQHNDAIKEIARSNQSAIERIQAFMMNPRDMAALMQEQARSAEMATERVTKFFGSVVEMQQRATENILQIQPSGSSVVEVIRDGVASVKDVAEKYVGAKAASERLAMQAQKDVAEAQARAIEAQAQVQIAQTQPIVTPPPRQQGQLAGPPPVTMLKKKPKPAASSQPATPTLSVSTANAPKRLGRTDEEWFTAALLPEVEQLREEAAKFIASCEAVRDGKAQEIEGASPEQATVGVLVAVQHVMQHQVAIPAMMELLFEERFADFVDVLVPNVPQTYRDELTQTLIAQVERMSGEKPNPKPAASQEIRDADDEEEVEEEEEEEEEVEEAPPAAPSTQVKNGARARANA